MVMGILKSYKEWNDKIGYIIGTTKFFNGTIYTYSTAYIIAIN